MGQVYKDLLKKYNILLEENKKLKTELAFLKGETSLPMSLTKKLRIFRDHLSINTAPQKKKLLSSVRYSKEEMMFLLDIGIVKLQIKAVISLFVKMNGTRNSVKRKNINVPCAQIVN